MSKLDRDQKQTLNAKICGIHNAIVATPRGLRCERRLSLCEATVRITYPEAERCDPELYREMLSWLHSAVLYQEEEVRRERETFTEQTIPS